MLLTVVTIRFRGLSYCLYLSAYYFDHFNVIACAGHELAASLQSHLSHPVGSLTLDFPSSPNSKTFGQVDAHSPHPIHFSLSTDGTTNKKHFLKF